MTYMFNINRSHHDPANSGYSSHVIGIRGFDFCSGCFASKTFLVLLLPILYLFFIFPNSLAYQELEWLIISVLWSVIAISFLVEVLTGKVIRRTTVNFFNSFYFFGSIIYISLVPSQIDEKISFSLVLAFALPQFGIYLYKILRKSEFNHIKSKIMIRLSFIVAFFFSLLNFTENIINHTLIIVISSILFIKLRILGSFSTDPSKKLYSTLHLHNNSIITRFLNRLNYFDPNGELKTGNFRNKSKFSKINFIMIIGLFYLINLVRVSSSSELINNCADDWSKSHAILASTPWLLMSSSPSNFCNKCGTKVSLEDSFCLKCGNQIAVQPQTQYQQQDRYQDNQQYQRGGYAPYPTQQRSGRKEKNMAIPIVVAVIFAFVGFAVGGIVFGLIIGVIAFIGAYLVISTNNPCLAYCIASTFCNCLCSAIGGESQRRGRM